MRGIAPKASVPKGVLRFVLLLVAACLVGALVGIVTEPFSNSQNPDPRADLPTAALPESTANAERTGTKAAPAGERASTTPERSPESAALAASAAGDDPSLPSVTEESAATRAAGTSNNASGNAATPGPRGARALAEHLKPDLTGLAVVGALLVAFAVIAFVFAKKNRLARASNGVVHLVDSLPIAPGRSVHLLRCEGRKFLIGNSERGLHFLASVPQNDVERSLDAVVADDAPNPSEGEPSFEALLAGSARR